MVRSMFALNFLAPVELVRQLVPLIPRGGAVVNISSIAGKVPLPWLTLYSSSKFALNAFSDGLRMELTPAGIHVFVRMSRLRRHAVPAQRLAGQDTGKSRRAKAIYDHCRGMRASNHRGSQTRQANGRNAENWLGSNRANPPIPRRCFRAHGQDEYTFACG